MSIISQLRLLYLCYFSKPVAERPIYRAIRRHRVQKIVELGVADGRRALRMIEVAGFAASRSDVHYVGMDLFEDRPHSAGPGMSLKATHQLLRKTGARVQLMPGIPSDGLMRLANALGKVDLLIVPTELDSASSAHVWFFVPRMLHKQSLVFVEGKSPDGQPLLRAKPRDEIDRLAQIAVGHRAA